jgi:hypothetical protein
LSVEFHGLGLGIAKCTQKNRQIKKIWTTVNIMYTNAHNKLDELQYFIIDTTMHITHTTLCHTNNVHGLCESHPWFCNVHTTMTKHNTWSKLQSPSLVYSAHTITMEYNNQSKLQSLERNLLCAYNNNKTQHSVKTLKSIA